MNKLIASLIAAIACGCYQTEVSELLTEPGKVIAVGYEPAVMGENGRRERFSVTFSCQHGEFTIEGSGQRHADLWKKMKQGEPVTITYREVYHVTRKKGSQFHDFEFFDANPITQAEL